MAGPFDVYTMGRMAVIQDPTGAVISVWQPMSHKGTTITGVPGTHCWADLSTTDVDKAKDFYQKLFGWEIAPGEHDTSGYLHIKNGKDFIGGKVGREKVSEKLCGFHGSPAAWSFDSHLGIERKHRGGVISSRFRMREAAADGAAVPHLLIANRFGRLGHRRAFASKQRRHCDVVMNGACADFNPSVVLTDP